MADDLIDPLRDSRECAALIRLHYYSSERSANAEEDLSLACAHFYAGEILQFA